MGELYQLQEMLRQAKNALARCQELFESDDDLTLRFKKLIAEIECRIRSYGKP